MRLQNTTDFPSDRIREIIKFVKPKNLITQRFTVRVTNSSCSCSNGKILIPRVHVIVRLSTRDVSYPQYIDRGIEIRRPWRTFTLYFDKFNNRTGLWEENWHSTFRYQSVKDKPKKFNSGGYISNLQLSREESLVHVIAHELRHLWHADHIGKRGKVWGSKGQFSDRNADAYAIKMVRAWRRLHDQPQAVNWKLIEEGCF